MIAASHPIRDQRGDRITTSWLMPVSLALLLPLIGAIASLALAAGLLAPDLADRWTRALLATADVGAFRDLTGTAYPILPLVIDMGFALVPGLGGMPPPLLVNVLALTLAAGLWVRMLMAGGHRWGWALMTAGLMAAGPALSLSVATGGMAPLGLLPFTIAVSAALRLQRRGEVNAMISLGVSLALLAVTDAAGAYLVLAAIPFIALMLPPGMVARSASGSMLVVLFPVMFTGLAMFYVNWVFGGSPLAFAAGVDAAIKGSAARIGDSVWLLGPGGSIMTALAAGSVLMLASAPLLPVGLLLADAGARKVLALLSAMVLVAVGLTSATWFLGDPGRVLTYLMPVAVLAASVSGPHRLRGLWMAALALVGLAGGWAAQGIAGDAGTDAWRRAMIGTAPPGNTGLYDIALGRYLRALEDVAIDGLTAGAVVPARGTADGLVLPSNDRLKADLITGQLRSTYVALRDPASSAGTRDRLSQALPDLWQNGMAGAVLIYDRGGWRVWRLAPVTEMGTRS